MSTKELTKEIEQRFEMVLAIAVIFPVLLATYFAITSGASDNHYQTIAFGFFGIPGLYIISFVIFQIIKRLPAPKWSLITLDWALLLGIACFAAPIIDTVVIAAKGSVPLTFTTLIDAGFFIASMWGMVYLSFGMVAFSCLCLGVGITEYFTQRRK